MKGLAVGCGLEERPGELLGTPLIVVVFVAAGIATWIAGLYRRATDVPDERFKLGDAVGGMLLLGLAVYGLLVRQDRKQFGLGRDSWIVLIVYIFGVLLLTEVPG